MASAELNAPVSKDWVLANPWFWMGIGLTATALAWGWVLVLQDAGSPIRLCLVFFGLLSIGVALRLRLGSGQPAFLESAARPLRNLALLGLMLLFGLMGLTVTVLLVLRIAGVDPFFIRPNKLVILWFIVTPMSVVAVQLVYRRRDPSWRLSAAEESSALLALAALACFFSCRALYLGEARAQEWDSIRLLLAVGTLVAIVAAPLVVVPQNIRRGVISLLILLHFGGICTAVLAAPPAPWIIQQIWTRIYRPYLEFMYLNNAYHFYAPDPGPARYVWFRLIYDDGKGNGKDSEVGVWLKVPEFDHRGRHQYAMGLQYSRYMALTENTVARQASPGFWEIDEKGKSPIVVPAPFYQRRLRQAPGYQPKLGEMMPPKGSLVVPFSLPHEPQYSVPSPEVRQLLESFARHVTRIPHPEHPDYKILGVKIYTVIHIILPEGPFVLAGMHPADPEFLRPTFMGEYRFIREQLYAIGFTVGVASVLMREHLFSDGEQLTLRKNDPFLYWLLPIRHDFRPPQNEQDPGSILIRDFCRKHAGDPNWVQHLQMNEEWTPKTPWIRWSDE